jgi:type III pantothenate kinase
VTGASAPVLLAIDIGNTNVTLGTFVYGDREPVLGEHWRLATHRGQTSDEVGVVLRALFDQAAIDTRRVTDVIVSSVVPPLLPIWERVSTKLFDREPLVVGPGIRTGVPVRTENPHEVGADRIVNSVAAFEWMGGPVIAVDFGTATTFDCVSAKGEYLGGAIFPGMLIAMEALFERAAMLRRIELAPPRSVIHLDASERNTRTSSLDQTSPWSPAGLQMERSYAPGMTTPSFHLSKTWRFISGL